MSASRSQIRQSIARSARLTALIAEAELQGEAMRGGFTAATLQKPGTEPKWNVIFPRGKWHGPNFASVGGSFTIDDAFMSEVLENWKAAGSPRIPVRWGHEHMEGNATPEQMRALDRKAGNVLDLRITAAGLEGLTEWNAEGAADVSSGAFDGWSAEWWPKHTNRLTGEQRGMWLSGVALTNRPYFNLLPRIAASLVESTDHPKQEQQMTPEQLKKWALSLGLSADSTLEQCLKASTAQGEELAALKAAATPTIDTAAITAAVKANVEPLQTQLTAAQAETKKLKDDLLDKDVEALIATAKRGDGKQGRAITDALVVIAKDLAKSKGIEAASKFLNELPLTVPITATAPQGDGNGPLTAAAASEKLKVEVEKLTKEGNITPWLSAVARNPELARIAQEGK